MSENASINWDLNDRPNHRCKVCGALWWLGVMPHGKRAWSLRSERCGPCCDNVAMGEQIEPLSDAYEKLLSLLSESRAEVEKMRASAEKAKERAERRSAAQAKLKQLGQWEREHMPCLNCGRAVFAGGCCDAPDFRSRAELREALSESREREGVMREAILKVLESPHRFSLNVLTRALHPDPGSFRSQVIEECAQRLETEARWNIESDEGSRDAAATLATAAETLRSLAKEKKNG